MSDILRELVTEPGRDPEKNSRLNYLASPELVDILTRFALGMSGKQAEEGVTHPMDPNRDRTTYLSQQPPPIDILGSAMQRGDPLAWMEQVVEPEGTPEPSLVETLARKAPQLLEQIAIMGGAAKGVAGGMRGGQPRMAWEPQFGAERARPASPPRDPNRPGGPGRFNKQGYLSGETPDPVRSDAPHKLLDEDLTAPGPDYMAPKPEPKPRSNRPRPASEPGGDFFSNPGKIYDIAERDPDVQSVISVINPVSGMRQKAQVQLKNGTVETREYSLFGERIPGPKAPVRNQIEPSQELIDAMMSKVGSLGEAAAQADTAVSGGNLPQSVLAARSALPEPKAGTVRLWRVEGPSAVEAGGAGGKKGGDYFERNLGAYVTENTNPSDIRYVDIPIERFRQLQSDSNSTEVRLPEGYVAQATPLAKPEELSGNGGK